MRGGQRKRKRSSKLPTRKQAVSHCSALRLALGRRLWRQPSPGLARSAHCEGLSETSAPHSWARPLKVCFATGWPQNAATRASPTCAPRYPLFSKHRMADEDYDGDDGGALLHHEEVDDSQLKIPQFSWAATAGPVATGEEAEDAVFKTQCVSEQVGGTGSAATGLFQEVTQWMRKSLLWAAGPCELHEPAERLAAACAPCSSGSGLSKSTCCWWLHAAPHVCAGRLLELARCGGR